MGKVTRNRHGAEFKARVALEAIKGEQTLAEIGARHKVHLTLVAAQKKASIAGLTKTFSAKAATPGSCAGAAIASAGRGCAR